MALFTHNSFLSVNLMNRTEVHCPTVLLTPQVSLYGTVIKVMFPRKQKSESDYLDW